MTNNTVLLFPFRSLLNCADFHTLILTISLHIVQEFSQPALSSSRQGKQCPIALSWAA
jgi:hypothetical protein